MLGLLNEVGSRFFGNLKDQKNAILQEQKTKGPKQVHDTEGRERKGLQMQQIN